MARFEVVDDEGVSFVKILLHNETVRAESGALCYRFGDIEIDALIPSIARAVRNVLAGRAVVRPTHSGTGVPYLESSVGGFQELEMDGNT